MGILSALFGSKKVIDSGIDGIDAMFFTDEEQSKAKMAFLKLYEPYKIAQRWLMVFVSVPYVLLWLLVGIIFIVDIFIDKSLDTSKIMLYMNGDMGTAFVSIVLFYFGGGAVEGVVKRFGK